MVYGNSNMILLGKNYIKLLDVKNKGTYVMISTRNPAKKNQLPELSPTQEDTIKLLIRQQSINFSKVQALMGITKSIAELF